MHAIKNKKPIPTITQGWSTENVTNLIGFDCISSCYYLIRLSSSSEGVLFMCLGIFKIILLDT